MLPTGPNAYMTSLFSSYAGCDIVCSITVPMLTNDQYQPGVGFNPSPLITAPITIATLQTVSISTHRDKVPVRALKSINPRGFTRGCRTIAGSLIFTMFDRESLYAVENAVSSYYQQVNTNYSTATGNLPAVIARMQADEVPPFDITITMVNEYGQSSLAKIIGVEIVTNGITAGIDDLILEEQMSYIALDYVPLQPAYPTVVSSGAVIA
jgi:hypothetical protein